MNEKHITTLKADLVVHEGTSKTGNKYRMTKVIIDTEIYGKVEILLDTRHDRAGIILDMIAKNIY